MSKKNKKGKQEFDPQEFEGRLEDLMVALKNWENYSGEEDDALELIWEAYLGFKKPYKRFRKMVSDQPDQFSLNGFFDSISRFLVLADKYGENPDHYFDF